MLHDSWQKASRTKGTRADGGAAVALLPDFAVIRFTGSDVLTFLQGYLTVDTGALTADDARLAALTNLQGRVVADGWCTSPRPDVVEWSVHRSLTQHIAGFLHRYLAFSRTTMDIRADDHLVLGVLDANASPSLRVVGDTPALETLLERHVPVSADDWRSACIDARVAVVTLATTEAFLPQMLGLVAAGAVDFDKGCYLGQEVVARAQHRGEVKRGPVRLDGPKPVLEAGDGLRETDDRQAGVIINAVPTSDGQRCLGVVRLPASERYLTDRATLNAY